MVWGKWCYISTIIATYYMCIIMETIKPFYLWVNEDWKTVATFDMIIPKVRVQIFLNLPFFLETSHFIPIACSLGCWSEVAKLRT